MKLLTSAEVARIGQLAGMVETTPFPAAWYFEDEARGLRAIAAELRRIVGLSEPDDLPFQSGSPLQSKGRQPIRGGENNTRGGRDREA